MTAYQCNFFEIVSDRMCPVSYNFLFTLILSVSISYYSTPTAEVRQMQTPKWSETPTLHLIKTGITTVALLFMGQEMHFTLLSLHAIRYVKNLNIKCDR